MRGQLPDFTEDEKRLLRDLEPRTNELNELIKKILGLRGVQNHDQKRGNKDDA